jgi:alkylhydroperoxidase family enzyme
MRIIGLGLVLAGLLGTAAHAQDAAVVPLPKSSKAHAAKPVANTPPGTIRSGAEAFDYGAREKQVASGEQRIAPLAPADFDKDAKDIAASLQAFFGSKEEGIPKTFATMARHPGLYRGQMQLGLELNQHGKLPPREREMVILRTAWLVRSPFEWGEHVAYGKRLGLSSDEIERITRGSSAPGWNEHDRAVLRGVEELIGDYALSDETWKVLAKTWNEPQLMELPGLVGSYTLTAMLYNSLRFGLLKGNDGFRTR